MTEVTARAMGVDGCSKGWIGLTNDQRSYFGKTIAELVAAADADGEVSAIGIDIPIGLPDTGHRQADLAAKALLGRRAASVFMTPVRAAIEADSYAKAASIQRKATGKGLTSQAYGLRTRILDVDQWRRSNERIAFEVHPELCFRIMGGRPAKFSKTTWAGMSERSDLLYDGGVIVPGELGKAGEVAAPDDVLDAAAVLWTATRFLSRTAKSYPERTEVFSDGLPAAIWA